MESEIRVCRTCLKEESDKKFTSIFENKQIPLNIFLISQVSIVENDKIPAIICDLCLDELSRLMKFRYSIVKADEYFRKHVSSAEQNSWRQKEPQILIKTEREEIKNEPADSNYDMMENIEMIFDNQCTSFDDPVNSGNESDINTNDYLGRERRRGKHAINYLEPEESDVFSIRCNLCLKVFPNKSSKLEHMKNVHHEVSDRMYTCSHCDKHFKNKMYLNRHFSRVHSASDKKKRSNSNAKRRDSALYCEICKQFFTTKAGLQKHIKVKHDFIDAKDKYMCDFCGRNFIIKYYLIHHIRVKHLKHQVEKKKNDAPFPCEICGKILKNRGLLKPHMRSHKVMTADDYYYCDLCPRKFKTRGGCTWHIQQRHVLKMTFPCKQCPVIYKSKWELKTHVKSKHTTIRDFCCEICGKGFLDKQKLQIHTRIHTGERPHACHLCPQTFIHQTDLRRHIWGHTGERPYKCEVPNCGKGFMKRSELLNHNNRCHVPAQPFF